MSKKIFITGGSRGIGFAIARKFHQEGYEVIICGRNLDNLNNAKEQIPGLHGYQCDLSDKAAAKALAQQINDTHGPLDILVNNAGVYQPGSLLEEEDSLFESTMATNLFSAYYITRGVLPGMLAKKAGTIFNICSVASIMPYAHASGSSYSISKYALLGFSKNLREEVKDKGLRVMSILPGAVYTDSWVGAGFPEERMMSIEDIADIVWGAYNLSGRTVMEEIVCRPQLGDI